MYTRPVESLWEGGIENLATSAQPCIKSLEHRDFLPPPKAVISFSL